MKPSKMSTQHALPPTLEPTEETFVVQLVEVRGVIMIITRYLIPETPATNRTLELLNVKVNCSVVNHAVIVR